MMGHKRDLSATRERVYYSETNRVSISSLSNHTGSICYSLGIAKSGGLYEFLISSWKPSIIKREVREDLLFDEKSSLTIRTHQLEKFCIQGTLMQKLKKVPHYTILPVTLSRLATDFTIAIKLHEGWTIHTRDVINTANQELRQRALKSIGVEKFLKNAKMQKVHGDRHGTLFRAALTDIQFVRVVDPSTGNVYMLQVPPTVTRAKEAVAWGYGLREDEYDPLVES